MATKISRVKVRRMTEFGSKNWGVYVNGKLHEGGFFSHTAALMAASILWRDRNN